MDWVSASYNRLENVAMAADRALCSFVERWLGARARKGRGRGRG